MENMEEVLVEKSTAKAVLEQMLSKTDITLNGKQEWDIQVHNKNLYQRLLNEGTISFGESYMEKWWDCKKIDVLCDKICRAQINHLMNIPLSLKTRAILSKFINFQTKSLSKKVAHTHYNLSNDLFKKMLDQRMIYSCAYWKDAQTLDEAQAAKLDLICKKLYLKAGEHLLDIGCGWGGLAKFAAENYGVKVTGITISEEQFKYAKAYCAGLPIDIRCQDYRELDGLYDKIVSVGMFEHVGPLNYRPFMQIAHKLLADHGIFLLHTIGTDTTGYPSNPWIQKYIFPNGYIPSAEEICKAALDLFVLEDVHNFGADYDKTLMAWYHNFVSNWQSIKTHFDERFYRMWTFYLLSCAGGFRSRTLQLWQYVFSKKGIINGYQSIR